MTKLFNIGELLHHRFKHYENHIGTRLTHPGLSHGTKGTMKKGAVCYERFHPDKHNITNKQTNK
jgi:hypothetical protein